MNIVIHVIFVFRRLLGLRIKRRRREVLNEIEHAHTPLHGISVLEDKGVNS